MFVHNEGDESADDTPKKEAEEARRTKALALWKARQKRNNLSLNTLDVADLSRCGFLEEDTNSRRELYRDQIERACGMSNSRDASASCIASDNPISAPKSTDALGVQRDAGSVKDSSRSRFAPLQFSKRGGPRSALMDVNNVPEWERRKICLERKEVHRRSGTSIGKWAFAAERGLNGSSSNPSNSAPNISTGGLQVSVRRKRSRGQEVTAAAAPQASSRASNPVAKKPKKSRRSLLSILGSRPTAD